MKRQLAAILYADVAGYSRLTGQNEEQTHQQLSQGLTLLIDTIATYGGRKVHEAGDAILAEFSSVTAAVDAAVEFQRAMATTGTPDTDRVQFRIGVNVGEVIHDRDDIYGDGVNIAARIQDIAPPGGLCISSLVHEQLSATHYDFDDLGFRDFKNIERPIHVYQLHAASLSHSHPMQEITARVERQPLFDDDSVEAQQVTAGRCVCGSIRFEINQPAVGTGFCHCRICQRSTGAPVFAWTAFPFDAVKFTHGQPKYYRLSLIAEQGFCEHCGTPVAWRSLKPEPTNYLVIATTALDNPADYAPTWHGCVESQVPWLQIHDDLPRMRSTEAPMLRKAWASVGATDPGDWKELGYEQAIKLDNHPESS